MKYIYLTLLFSTALFAATYNAAPQYVSDFLFQQMTIKEKKARFYALVVPAVQKVHKELMTQYETTLSDINNSTNLDKIEALKEAYKVKTDEKLLAALKPHPPSITLAQAAMESAWGTSRFFLKANNIFGIYSVNKNEPRIAASEKREGKKTVWLKKYATIEASVRAYYRLMAKGYAFEEFRALRAQTDDPHQLVKKLDRYSEIGAAYGKELSQVITYNRLTKYDK